jgi:hypothetical protein
MKTTHCEHRCLRYILSAHETIAAGPLMGPPFDPPLLGPSFVVQISSSDRHCPLCKVVGQEMC